MRFKRWPRIEAFEDTNRKRAAAARSQQKARDKLPLLSAIVAEQQPTIDDVMTTRAARYVKSQQAARDKRAADWRRARARLASYGDNARASLLAYWQRNKWPGDPSYLLMMLHMYDTNRLSLD